LAAGEWPQHAELALQDLKPQQRAEVLSDDGREWYLWNNGTQKLEAQKDAYVLRSMSERGYWSNAHGWVFDVVSAIRFPLEEIEHLNLSIAHENEVEHVRVDDSPKDFGID